MCLVTACGGSFPDYSTENAGNGNVRIPLAVLPSPSGTERSLYNDVAVKELIDYYEVVFKGGSGYYKGIADRGQRYLTLTVPVGDDYKVLLLAGNSHYGTLLASAYNGDVDIVPGTNTVSMNISAIKINAGDLKFVINGGSPQSVQSRPISSGREYRYISLSQGDTNIVLTVEFHGQLDNLASAEGAGGTFTAISNVLTVLPYGGGSSFPLYVESDSVSVSSDSFSYAAIPAIPSNDVTGIAHFEVKYCAFGTTDSGGRTWSITNGLNSGTMDIKDDIGGGILVIVGNGGTVVLPL
jgi:hypothetical protein